MQARTWRPVTLGGISVGEAAAGYTINLDETDEVQWAVSEGFFELGYIVGDTVHRGHDPEALRRIEAEVLPA